LSIKVETNVKVSHLNI